MSHRRGRWPAAVIALVLAGCGSDSAPATDATVITAVPTVATTATATTPAAPADGGVATTVPPASSPPTTAPAGPLEDVAVGFTEVVTLDQPMVFTTRPGFDELWYVAERPGRVRVIGDGIDEVVLDIGDDTTTEAERGLLGLAFSPNGEYLYLSYTDDDGDTQLDEYGIVEDGTVDTNSRRTILQFDQPYPNHNGGHVTFGTDGYLYLGLGDGGAADDPERTSLDPQTLLGKLIRIDPSTPADGFAYSVPADNPFVGVEGARPEIWSLGLRNPWRFSFDPATGDLWIGDVGQNQWEEIDLAPASEGAGRGVSFGWSAYEGTHRFNEDQPADGHAGPLLEYQHGDDGCSVTGGAVYRGTAIPDLVGAYVYGDYCSGNVWAVRPPTDGSPAAPVVLGRVPALVHVGTDAAGELYLVSLNGPIVRLDPA